MEQSIAERIFCVIEKRLRRISKTDGYNTDAGLNVFRARRSIDISMNCPLSVFGTAAKRRPILCRAPTAIRT
jgi:hypothetical protein